VEHPGSFVLPSPWWRILSEHQSSLGLVRLPPPRPGTRPDPRGYPGPGLDTGPLKFQCSVCPGMVCSRPKTPLILPNPTGIQKSPACSREQTPHVRGTKREAALVAVARLWWVAGERRGSATSPINGGGTGQAVVKPLLTTPMTAAGPSSNSGSVGNMP
jgi:hypothetical protein